MSNRFFSRVIVIGFLTLLSSEGWGKDWKPYQATKYGDIYYFDSESIEKLPEGVIRVWTKTEKTEFIGGDLVKHVDEVTSGGKDKVIGEIIQLLEINCSSKQFRVINLAVYDKNRDIKEYYNEPSEWDGIAPESVTNSLQKEICR
jgi:hypothetical protein